MDGAPMGFGLEADLDDYGGNAYDDDEDQYGENADNSENVYEENEEVVVPKMPDDFYSDVDTFLNRPPPKAKGLKQKSKTREKLEEKIVKSTSFPNILLNQKPKKIESKVNTGRKGPGKKNDKRIIDDDLLQQAFEYTEKLQREATLENEYDEIIATATSKKKSNSAPHNLQSHTRLHHETENDGEDGWSEEEEEEDMGRRGRMATKNKVDAVSAAYGNPRQKPPKSLSKGQAKKGVVRRLRSQTADMTTSQREAKEAAFDASSAAQDTTSRYAVDFDALVANFEQGTTLRALKAELEESRASLARSKQAVQKISSEMASQIRR